MGPRGVSHQPTPSRRGPQLVLDASNVDPTPFTGGRNSTVQDVVDSSALIPLPWVGRLDLITAAWDQIRTTEHVRDEVLTEGKRRTAPLKSFLADVSICEPPPEAENVASLEGIAVADASVMTQLGLLSCR